MRRYGRTEEEYKAAAINATSIAQMCRLLGLIPAGGNFTTVKSKILFYNINVDHFLGKAPNRGKVFVEFPKNNRGRKQRLITERGYACERCKNSEWLDQPIALELEHVDGDTTNNLKENLLLLCPNCHAQTPTWRRAKSSFEAKTMPTVKK